MLCLPPRRAVSTVTTTARWGGARTPTWPYPPAVGCSKWAAQSDSLLSDSDSSIPVDLASLFPPPSACQRDVWRRTPRVSNRALTPDPFNRELSPFQSNTKCQKFPAISLRHKWLRRVDGFCEDILISARTLTKGRSCDAESRGSWTVMNYTRLFTGSLKIVALYGLMLQFNKIKAQQ